MNLNYGWYLTCSPVILIIVLLSGRFLVGLPCEGPPHPIPPWCSLYIPENVPNPLPKLFLLNPIQRPYPHLCPDSLLYMTCWIWCLVCLVVVDVGRNVLFNLFLNAPNAWAYVVEIGTYVNLLRIEALIGFSHSRFTFSVRVLNFISSEWTTLPLCFT